VRQSDTLLHQKARQLQATVETINLDMGSKRKQAALDGVRKTRTIISQKQKDLTSSCRDASKCTSILNSLKDTLDPLEASLKDSLDAFQGSEQERAALDAAYAKQHQAAEFIGALEEQMIPAGYVTPVPEDYDDLPQLKGRATVEMTFRKPDGGPFNVNGQNYPSAKMTMVIDGYVCKWFFACLILALVIQDADLQTQLP
jgi:peptidylprolyl isomerase